MRIVEIDASGWNTVLDFYETLLAALGAPDWHGRSLNALIDSMIYGDINAVEAPFRVEFEGLASASEDAVTELRETIDALAAHGAVCTCHGTTASIQVVYPLSAGTSQIH